MDVAIEELSGVLSSREDVEGQVEAAELTKIIDQFLAQLKQVDRVVFMRRYYFSDSYEDIARLTGISEKNVSVKLNRVRNKLREHLRSKGYVM